MDEATSPVAPADSGRASFEPDPIPSPSKYLYVSHFLSTFNSRLFEFGAVLFLAHIYPNTLLPVSIYAICRAASAMLISPAIGRQIDRKGRLFIVRLSIIAQRLAVAFSCTTLLLLVFREQKPSINTVFGALNLAFLSLLAIVEKLSAIINLVSVEKDWVVVLARGDEVILRNLNAKMRRIDLICKLGGPLAIAVVDSWSTSIALLATLATNVVSVIIEIFTIEKVYRSSPVLHQSPPAQRSPCSSLSSISSPYQSLSSTSTQSSPRRFLPRIPASLKVYITSPAFLPSFSISLLYLTVLSFNSQMSTYLLATSITPLTLGLFRSISIVFELTSTWLAPRIMSRIGPIRAGLWSLNWQLSALLVGITLFLRFPSTPFPLIVAVILSRTGLWSFDLCVQLLVQELVSAPHRGAFSTTEAAAQNLFEMLAFASTIVWSDVEGFKYPVLISGGATVCAAAIFAAFVRRERGHLMHVNRCLRREEKRSVEQEEQEATTGLMSG